MGTTLCPSLSRLYLGIGDASRDEITDTLRTLNQARIVEPFGPYVHMCNPTHTRSLHGFNNRGPSRLVLPNPRAPTLEIPVVVRRYSAFPPPPGSIRLGRTDKATIAALVVDIVAYPRYPVRNERTYVIRSIARHETMKMTDVTSCLRMPYESYEAAGSQSSSR